MIKTHSGPTPEDDMPPPKSSLTVDKPVIFPLSQGKKHLMLSLVQEELDTRNATVGVANVIIKIHLGVT